jgi:hypothetical protein
MPWVTIIVLVILGVAAFLLKARSRKETAEYPYQKTDSLFSPAERSFLGVLEQSVGDRFRILGKIRVADVLSPTHGLSKGERQKAFNRISSKHLDLALCKKDDMSLVCAIELDDSYQPALLPVLALRSLPDKAGSSGSTAISRPKNLTSSWGAGD